MGISAGYVPTLDLRQRLFLVRTGLLLRSDLFDGYHYFQNQIGIHRQGQESQRV